MEIDEDLLTQDLVFTANELNGNNNRYFVSKNRDIFNILNQALFLNFDKIVFSTDAAGFGTSEELEKLLDLRFHKEHAKFVDFTNKNENTFINMSGSFLKIVNDLEMYYVPMKGKKVFSEDELKDVILSYYAQFGNVPYKIARRYFDENRIQTQNKDVDPRAGGYFACLPWLESGYIFSNYQRNKVTSAAAIAHELGHAIDADAFCFKQQRDGFSDISDFLLEFPSTAYEIAFIDYLKKNHIANVDANKYFIERIHLVKDFMETIKTVMGMKESIVDAYGYAMDEEDSKALEEIFKEAVVYFKKNKPKDEFNNPEAMEEFNKRVDEEMTALEELEDSVTYNLKSALKYGFGYYAALHSRLIYEKDPQEFAKIIHNICCSRGRITLEQVVDMMGFDLDIFTSGELIQPKIESEYLELKRRYKL